MNESLKELEARQKRELKELQGKIQAIKKAVPKGDKKAKKKCGEEIALLQTEVEKRHNDELKSLQETLNGINMDEEESAVKVEEAPEASKKSRAEKRREAKVLAEQQKLAEMDDALYNAEPSMKSMEHIKISNIIKADNLSVYDIPADGNCLFCAIQHQLSIRGRNYTVTELRNMAADHIRSNKDEFLPYLVQSSTGELMSDEDVEHYCKDMRNDGIWGGMHESHALSTSLKLPIKIIQADVPPIIFGEENEGAPIVLLFYKYKFGLGEHYDSVVDSS